ncbi:MAG: hypothetical protein AAGF04_05725 [Chlamydiota bacterium]
MKLDSLYTNRFQSPGFVIEFAVNDSEADKQTKLCPMHLKVHDADHKTWWRYLGKVTIFSWVPAVLLWIRSWSMVCSTKMRDDRLTSLAGRLTEKFEKTFRDLDDNVCARLVMGDVKKLANELKRIFALYKDDVTEQAAKDKIHRSIVAVEQMVDVEIRARITGFNQTISFTHASRNVTHRQ